MARTKMLLSRTERSRQPGELELMQAVHHKEMGRLMETISRGQDRVSAMMKEMHDRHEQMRPKKKESKEGKEGKEEKEGKEKPISDEEIESQILEMHSSICYLESLNMLFTKFDKQLEGKAMGQDEDEEEGGAEEGEDGEDGEDGESGTVVFEQVLFDEVDETPPNSPNTPNTQGWRL